MEMPEGHGAFEKEETLVGRVRVFKWGWSMAMGPLKWKKTVIGRVRVSMWGWAKVKGPVEKEEGSGWEGQGV